MTRGRPKEARVETAGKMHGLMRQECADARPKDL